MYGSAIDSWLGDLSGFLLICAVLVLASSVMSVVWWLMGFPGESNDSDGHRSHLRKRQRRG